jgi:NDP-4-keto-2,6-dideoxyhexose 3-C-methyltransferase
MNSGTKCRICKGATKVALNLGMIYPSAFLDDNDPIPEAQEMILVVCEDCGLVQIGDHPPLDTMYRQYYYQSGINPSMVRALEDVVKCAMEYVYPEAGDVVVDIGANDGTTLSFYPDHVVKVAYEPALNIVEKTKEQATFFINDYFTAAAYPNLPKASIVTSLAMFYDLPDPPAFVKDVASILDEDGIWIIQISDLMSMLKTNSIDNPCWEHLEYYCTEDIIGLVEAEGLMVFRIDHNDVNSGSLRFYVCRGGKRKQEPSVFQTRLEEADFFNSPEGTLEEFIRRVDDAKEKLVRWLKVKKERGETVYGLAASTKANTLMQYFGIDKELIVAMGDLNPEKFGKHTVATNIPIISETEMMEKNPDYLLVFAWHFLPFFLEKFDDYMSKGGQLVAPLPFPKVYFKYMDGASGSEEL